MYEEILSKGCSGLFVSMDMESALRLRDSFPEDSRRFYLEDTFGFLAEILPKIIMRNAHLSFVGFREERLIFILKEDGIIDRALVMSGPEMPFGRIREEYEDMLNIRKDLWYYEGYKFFSEAYTFLCWSLGE